MVQFGRCRVPGIEHENHENAIKYRDHIAAKMTPEQVAEAQKLATEWKPSGPEGVRLPKAIRARGED